MTRTFAIILSGIGILMLGGGHAPGRGFGGFGGFRGGSFGGGFDRGFGGGGFDRSSFGSFSSERSGSFSGSGGRGFDYSGSRSGSAYSGWRGAGGLSSYDRSFSDARGGSLDVDGTRGVAAGPRGVAAGGTRDVTATTAGGRSYSGSSTRGAAVGPYGRTVGGAEHSGTASGPRGTVSGGWQSAFAGSRLPSDFGGLSHYASVGHVGAVGHSTTYWSHGYMTTHAGYVRSSFGYYNCFHPAWYGTHPGCWHPAAWAAGAAWRAAAWSSLASLWAIPAAPVNYDYGDTVVYQDNSVYVNGQDVGTAQAYNQQAVALADQGQKAQTPPADPWTALGVFALVQEGEKTSNNIFQLAVNKDGTIRGNYYDGLMDTSTPVYGSVDKKTQRAAWSIGKKNDRVFEAGIYNLTKSETSVLVHLGADQTRQMMLVRVEQKQ